MGKNDLQVKKHAFRSLDWETRLLTYHQKVIHDRYILQLQNRWLIYFIISTLKSLAIPAIWLALSCVIYSQIAPFLALNRIFFPGNEKGTLKQHKHAYDFMPNCTPLSWITIINKYASRNFLGWVVLRNFFYLSDRCRSDRSDRWKAASIAISQRS